MHEVGRSEIDGVTVADSLLERGLDLLVHANQPKRPSREQRGQRQPPDDEQGCDKLNSPHAKMGDMACANPTPA